MRLIYTPDVLAITALKVTSHPLKAGSNFDVSHGRTINRARLVGTAYYFATLLRAYHRPAPSLVDTTTLRN